MIEQVMRALTEDERLGLHELFYTRVNNIATGICRHVPYEAKDSRGHPAHPCVNCVKTVREVSFAWHGILRDQAVRVAEHAMRVNFLPYMGLHHAYEVAAGQLEPDSVKASERFGPL